MKPATALSLRQLSWCFALALSLLFAQFAGQRHRIDHTPWASADQPDAGVRAAWTDATHSCVALDAATLAAGLCASQLLLAPRAPAAAPWLSAALIHDLPVTVFFRSRAPPSLS